MESVKNIENILARSGVHYVGAEFALGSKITTTHSVDRDGSVLAENVTLESEVRHD